MMSSERGSKYRSRKVMSSAKGFNIYSVVQEGCRHQQGVQHLFQEGCHHQQGSRRAFMLILNTPFEVWVH